MCFVYEMYDVACKQLNDQLMSVETYSDKKYSDKVTCKYHLNINMRLVRHSDVY
jgi:hypothetical protein